MISKIYLKEGTRVFMKDSPASREIKSLYKDAVVGFDENNLYLEREGYKTIPDFEDEGIEKDENGFFIYLGDDL